jgi:hypothetical protein
MEKSGCIGASISTKMLPQQQFRFLDFPIELRYMVHQFITPVTRRRVIDTSDIDLTNVPSQTRNSIITLARQSLSTNILAACKLVRKEALPILIKALRQVEQQPTRIWMDMQTFTSKHISPMNKSTDKLLYAKIIEHCDRLLDHTTTNPVLGKHSHYIELALPASNPSPSQLDILLSMVTTWDIAIHLDAACAVFCQGLLPRRSQFPPPQFLSVLSQQYRNASTRVYELGEEDRRALQAEWAMS